MSLSKSSDDTSLREASEKLKQQRLAKLAADPAWNLMQYAGLFIAGFLQAWIIMYLWNGLQPLTVPRMDFLQAFLVMVSIKWLVSQKTAWEPADWKRAGKED